VTYIETPHSEIADMSLDEFLNLPNEQVQQLIAPHELSISLLINGTRRWFMTEHYDEPPTDNSYFPHYLATVLQELGRLLTLLADHGMHRVFIPVYSLQQEEREANAFAYLMEGIKALSRHPGMVDTYERSGYGVHFYGDMSYLPPQVVDAICDPVYDVPENPNCHVYYGVDGGNPHDYLLKLSYMFGMAEQRPPTWEDMLEMYYGDRNMQPLNILVAFNHIYARLGIPPLLDGQDRIYAMPITPLILNRNTLRHIIYDYVYNRQDPSRSYKDLHPNEFRRLKHYYAANQGVAVGLTRKYEDLTYPVSSVVWPEEMDRPDNDHLFGGI
jgi:hypothetical protein